MQNPKHLLAVAILSIGIVYLANLFVDVMEVDAAQYASIAQEMYTGGSYLEVYHRGADYLDKPPLLFWVSSSAMAILGVSNVSYKLPPLLILLLGIYATYRFALLYHDRRTAFAAGMILATTQAYFLMTNDVRTDGLLTGWVIFSVWQCAAYLKQPRPLHLILAGIGIGMAMLAKGPIGAVILAVTILYDRMLSGRWRDLFKPGWLIVVLIAAIVLLPMCYGLYMQFDLHPEKTVYQLQGPSGLKFFFWTQSFGRITGDIYWDNNTPVYYFLLTFLWDFMPWTLVALPALVYAIRAHFYPGKSYPEYATIGGFICVLVLLSLSRYKLPHYIFPLFPFAAIFTARYLVSGSERVLKVLSVVQFVLLHAFFLMCGIVYVLFFPPEHLWLPLTTVLGLIAYWVVYRRMQTPSDRILWTGVIAAVSFNLMMSLHFYPHLMSYQSGSEAGRRIARDKRYVERAYYAYQKTSYSLDFYAGAYVPDIDDATLEQIPAGTWIYTTESGRDAIFSRWPSDFSTVVTFPHYHVSMLKWKFADRRSRDTVLEKRYLLEKRTSPE